MGVGSCGRERPASRAASGGRATPRKRRRGRSRAASWPWRGAGAASAAPPRRRAPRGKRRGEGSAGGWQGPVVTPDIPRTPGSRRARGKPVGFQPGGGARRQAHARGRPVASRIERRSRCPASSATSGGAVVLGGDARGGGDIPAGAPRRRPERPGARRREGGMDLQAREEGARGREDLPGSPARARRLGPPRAGLADRPPTYPSCR